MPKVRPASPYIPASSGWQQRFVCAIVVLFRVIQHSTCCRRGWASVWWSHSNRFHVSSSMFSFKSNLPIWCAVIVSEMQVRDWPDCVCFITGTTFWIIMFAIIRNGFEYIHTEICEQGLFWNFPTPLINTASCCSRGWWILISVSAYPTGCIFSTV